MAPVFSLKGPLLHPNYRMEIGAVPLEVSGYRWVSPSMGHTLGVSRPGIEYVLTARARESIILVFRPEGLYETTQLCHFMGKLP